LPVLLCSKQLQQIFAADIVNNYCMKHTAQNKILKHIFLL